MKVKREWEASDIDPENNDVHRFLTTCIVGLIARITFTPTAALRSGDELDVWLRGAVAVWLTQAEDAGITIAKGEASPEVFRK